MVLMLVRFGEIFFQICNDIMYKYKNQINLSYAAIIYGMTSYYCRQFYNFRYTSDLNQTIHNPQHNYLS